MEKLCRKDILQSAKFRNKGKFRMLEEKKWSPAISLAVRFWFLREHVLRQVRGQPVGRLWSLMPACGLQPSSFTMNLWGLASNTHSVKISLVVQWLGLCAFTAKGPGSIPGGGTKILQATGLSQRKKKKIHTLSKQYWKIYEKSELRLNFLGKLFLKSCFL